MRNLMYLSLISFLGLSINVSATSTPQDIQQIINYLKEGKKIKDKKIILGERQFEEGLSDILPDAQQELDQIAEWLLKIPTVTLEISNHTDNKGDKDAKKQLTQRRAKNIVDYLTLKGVPYQQLDYKGWGFHRPVADNRTEEGRMKNNRTELLITGFVAGPHKIVTAQKTILADNLLLDKNKILYWETPDAAIKELALSELQKIEMAYGKELTFNATPSEKAMSPTPESVKEEKEIKIEKPAKTGNPSPVVKTEGTTKTNDLTTENTASSNQPTTTVRPNTLQKTPKEEVMTSKEEDQISSSQDIIKPNPAPPSAPAPAVEKPTTNVETSSLSEAEEQALITYYIDNYPLAKDPTEKEEPISSEYLLKQLNPAFTWKVEADELVETTGFMGKIKYFLTKPRKSAKSGLIFQLGKQPLNVEASSISFSYQDASGRAETIGDTKNLTASSTALVFRLGLMMEVDQWTGYFAGDFAANSSSRYNAAAFGLLYTKKIGKLRVMPGAEINLGAGKFNLTTVNPETPIFQVKKKEFLGENIRIDYKNKLLGISPSINLAYAISQKFDLYLSGGYALAASTASKIKFSGQSVEGSSITTHEKLTADGLNFRVNGETVTKNVDVFSYNGLFFKIGVIW